MSEQQNGIWSQWQADQYHQSSPKLAVWLASYLPKDKTVIDFGCGNAFYCAELSKEGFKCLGIEGYQLNNFLHDNVMITDLTKRIDISGGVGGRLMMGSVISLEVAEHIEKKHEQMFLNNITKHCNGHLIFSWAITGQPGVGHVNCVDQSYAIKEIERRGFDYLEVLSDTVRKNNIDENTSWFTRTLMIFKAKSSVRSR